MHLHWVCQYLPLCYRVITGGYEDDSVSPRASSQLGNAKLLCLSVPHFSHFQTVDQTKVLVQVEEAHRDAKHSLRAPPRYAGLLP